MLWFAANGEIVPVLLVASRWCCSSATRQCLLAMCCSLQPASLCFPPLLQNPSCFAPVPHPLASCLAPPTTPPPPLLQRLWSDNAFVLGALRRPPALPAPPPTGPTAPAGAAPSASAVPRKGTGAQQQGGRLSVNVHLMEHKDLRDALLHVRADLACVVDPRSLNKAVDQYARARAAVFGLLRSEPRQRRAKGDGRAPVGGNSNGGAGVDSSSADLGIFDLGFGRQLPGMVRSASEAVLRTLLQPKKAARAKQGGQPGGGGDVGGVHEAAEGRGADGVGAAAAPAAADPLGSHTQAPPAWLEQVLGPPPPEAAAQYRWVGFGLTWRGIDWTVGPHCRAGFSRSQWRRSTLVACSAGAPSHPAALPTVNGTSMPPPLLLPTHGQLWTPPTPQATYR